MAWQESLPFCRIMLVVKSFVWFIYTLLCSISKGNFSQAALQWFKCRIESSSSDVSKTVQLSMSNAKFCFLFIATPPQANSHFPIRGRKLKYKEEIVRGREGDREMVSQERDILNKRRRGYCSVFVSAVVIS